MLYTYFYKFFGVNALAETKLSKIDYSILDKLIKIPFSKEVKEEIRLRVKLQKQYCYDANGSLHSLNRFLKETINFIISRKDFNDFKLLNSLKDNQIDYTYMLNSTAKHNEVKSMKFIQKKLLSTNSNMLNEAMLYAVKSQSFEASTYLMQQRIKLDENTQNMILNEFKKEEFDIFYKKLSDTNNIKLLPSSKKFNVKNIRKVVRKNITSGVDNDVFYADFEQNLYAIVYNSIADMYMQYFIDDYTVELDKHKVYIKVWSHTDTYPINFFDLYENILRANGFRGWQEELALYNRNNIDMKKEIEFQVQKVTTTIFEDEIFENGIDHYEFINIEIL